MNFNLEPELQQLEESLSRLLTQFYSFSRRQAIAAGDRSESLECWKKLAELGVTGLGIPAIYGGFSGPCAVHLPVMRAGGRALWLEPYLPSVVLCATALREAGSSEQKNRWLTAIAAGQASLAWAHEEAAGECSRSGSGTTATRTDSTWRLTGKKTTVLYGSSADQLIVSARLSGAAHSKADHGLFLVDPKSSGVQQRKYCLIDDTPATDVILTDAIAEPLVEQENPSIASGSPIEIVLQAGQAAVCAEMLGVMECAYDLTRTYVNVRKQFGRAIAEHQAVRHRIADMTVSLELARSMTYAAAASVDGQTTDENEDDLARAKLVIGRHARALCHGAIQLHGGIGMTEEYAVGHCLRRIHVLDHLFGDTEAQLMNLASKQLQYQA